MNDYNAPADLLRDKVILITGAGDGIGAQAAKTYAAHGAICILLGRTVSKLEAVYDDIVAAGGGNRIRNKYPLHCAVAICLVLMGS